MAKQAEPETRGRVTITWPAPSANNVPLVPWRMTIHDYDTGANLGNITTVATVIHIDPQHTITADLTMLVNGDGQPIGDSIKEAARDGDELRTATFRYVVAEMRTAETDAEKQAREQWERLKEFGVKAGHAFRPDPGTVLTVTAPDGWTPDQHEEFQRVMSELLPELRVVVHPESVNLEVASSTDGDLLPPHDVDAEVHNYPALGQGKYGPCSCGRTL